MRGEEEEEEEEEEVGGMGREELPRVEVFILAEAEVGKEGVTTRKEACGEAAALRRRGWDTSDDDAGAPRQATPALAADL